MTIRNFMLAAVLCLPAGATLVLATQPVLAEQPVPAENNPPGDIPDNQVFVEYQGPGISMQVPEGWARTDEANGATFADKYNRIEITSVTAASPITASTVTNKEAKDLAASQRAVTITSIKDVQLAGGKAVRIDYSANSEPNPVTNKQIRLEDVRFYLPGSNGTAAVLDMSAPFGADNVDQWKLMADSLAIK
jgi:hypothetical protein